MSKMCYCHNCEKPFHVLGIMRHRAMHRTRKEDCKITYTKGDTWVHEFADKKGAKNEP